MEMRPTIYPDTAPEPSPLGEALVNGAFITAVALWALAVAIVIGAWVFVP